VDMILQLHKHILLGELFIPSRIFELKVKVMVQQERVNPSWGLRKHLSEADASAAEEGNETVRVPLLTTWRQEPVIVGWIKALRHKLLWLTPLLLVEGETLDVDLEDVTLLHLDACKFW